MIFITAVVLPIKLSDSPYCSFSLTANDAEIEFYKHIKSMLQWKIQNIYICKLSRKHFTIADVYVNGESLQIIRVARQDTNGNITHELELVEENLKKIMCHPDVKDNPVQIVSIAGAFRKGKSFLLGFFLKYLETQLQVINCYLKKQAKKREVRTHEILSSL